MKVAKRGVWRVLPAAIALALTVPVPVHADATFEYSPDIMASYHHWREDSEMLKVIPVNTDNRMAFKVIEKHQKSDLTLFRHVSEVVINDPTVSNDPEVCHGNVALQLGDGIIYCLSAMGILDSKHETARVITMLLFYKPSQADLKLSISLKIPLFVLPDQLRPEIAAEWASENNVTIASPFDLKQLDSIRANPHQTFQTGFSWMSKLFQYRVSAQAEFAHEVLRVFTTRPMALPLEVLRRLAALQSDSRTRHTEL